jgi:hypothetical protein
MADKQRDEISEETATWSGAILESQRALMENAISIQKQNMRLAWGFIEQSQKQWEVFQRLALGSMGTYKNLFHAPTSNSQVKIEANGNGQGLPIESYDRLSIEKVSRRLKELDADEIEELKAYEKSNKNRVTLIEKFDRSLV